MRARCGPLCGPGGWGPMAPRVARPEGPGEALSNKPRANARPGLQAGEARLQATRAALKMRGPQADGPAGPSPPARRGAKRRAGGELRRGAHCAPRAEGRAWPRPVTGPRPPRAPTPRPASAHSPVKAGPTGHRRRRRAAALTGRAREQRQARAQQGPRGSQRDPGGRSLDRGRAAGPARAPPMRRGRTAATWRPGPAAGAAPSRAGWDGGGPAGPGGGARGPLRRATGGTPHPRAMRGHP